MFYLDTSVLVTAITPEAETLQAQQWIADQRPGTLAISNWVVTEFSSALSIKVRTRVLSLDQRATALRIFDGIVAASFQVFEVQPTHFVSAARFADNAAAAIRGSDALHLAVASSNDATVCTFDKRLASGGSMIGLKTLLL